MESFDFLAWKDAMQKQAALFQVWFDSHEKVATVRPETGWSPAEVLEHLCLVELGVHQRLKTALQPLDASEKLGASKIRHFLVVRRDIKVDAPENLQPQGKWNNWKEAMTAFTANRNALFAAIESGDIQPTSMGMVHPRLGEMSVTDWLYFLNSHAERHWHQLQEAVSQ
jgi:hypothetical protein